MAVQKKSIFNQVLASSVVTLGIFALGTVLGYSSPALPSLLQEPNGHFANISKEDQSWIACTATLGAFASSPVGGISLETLGRKRTMLICSVPFILGWILIGFSEGMISMCLGRFITGFCGGLFSLTAPLYIGEISESKIRGILMNTFQLMLVSGILFVYLIGSYITWKALAFICCFIPFIFLALSIIIPETPQHLLNKDKYRDAKKALCWLRGTNMESKIVEELNNMKLNLDQHGQNSTKFRDFLKPNILKPLGISLSLMLLEQLSAFNVVIFYCVDIFASAGGSLDSHWASIIVAAVQVGATILSTFLVDNAGRRVLLLFSEAVMGLSFIALGAFFYLKKANNDIVPNSLGWLPLTSVIIFIVAFSIGIGPLSWTIMGEILPPQAKGFCSAIAVSLVWLSASFVTKIYQTLVDIVGIAWAFWIFSSISILGTFLVYFTVPETKGKTLDEIQLFFSASSTKEEEEEDDNWRIHQIPHSNDDNNE